MKITLKIDDKVAEFNVSADDAACVLASLGKKQVTKYEQISNKEGKLLYVDSAGEVTTEVTEIPLKNHVLQSNADGTDKMVDRLTFPDWIIRMMKGMVKNKIIECRKRAHMATFK